MEKIRRFAAITSEVATSKHKTKVNAIGEMLVTSVADYSLMQEDACVFGRTQGLNKPQKASTAE
jgi:hypothetical protein